MSEVLSFFFLIFAIFRLCVNIGADDHNRRTSIYPQLY